MGCENCRGKSQLSARGKRRETKKKLEELFGFTIDFPEVCCGDCSEKDCPKETEEINNMIYTRCIHAGRMPRVMNENAKVWNIFNVIRNNLLFRHYPFLLKSYLEGLRLHFSESEMRRLGYIYSLYISETARKYPSFFLPALINL